MNVARIASLRAGIPVEASAVTINRFCSSGLQSIAFAAEKIMVGWADTIVAGGTESMSLVPLGGHKIAPNPELVAHYPDVYLSTGLVAENHARESSISREEQDAYALRSHQRALAAMGAGRFDAETVPVAVSVAEPANGNGEAPVVREVRLERDEGPRSDTSLEALGKLRPAFRAGGSVTRGQLVADERRRGGGGRHDRRTRREGRTEAAGALRHLRDGGRPAGAVRHRPRPGDSQGAEDGRV